MTWGYFIQSHLEFKKGFFKNNSLTQIISFFITKFPLFGWCWGPGRCSVAHLINWTICNYDFISVQFSSVTQLCLTLWDPMNCSTSGLPVHHQLLEFTQIHVHWVGDAIQPSYPLSSPSPLAPNPSQHQGLFQWVYSSHEVAKVLEFQHQHQSFQWTPRIDL